VILANYTQENRNTVRHLGMGFTNPMAMFKPPLFLSFYTPDVAVSGRALSAFPNGYNTNFAWQLPLTSGGMGATAFGSGTISGTALAVKLALADLVGSGTISSASAGLIVQALAALTGSGTISSASLQAFLLGVASLTGSGTVSAAPLTGLGALLAALAGSGAATLTPAALGQLGAAITVSGTGITTENVGAAVWAQIIESGFSATQILRLLASVAAGKTDIVDLGGGLATVTFRDVNDTKDRIVADMTDSERTTVTKDAT
jgi:hypothetical protein